MSYIPTIAFPPIYNNNGSRVSHSYPLFNEKVGNFLQSADQDAANLIDMAEGRLHPTQSHPITFGKIKIGNTYNGVFFMNSFNTVNVQNPPQDRRDDDTVKRLILFILSTVVTGIALYKIGEWLNKARDSQEECDQMREFKQFIKPIKKDYSENTHVNDIATIVDCRKKIVDKIAFSAKVNLALAVAMAAAGVFCAIGALAGAPGLMVGGAVAGLAVGGAVLLKWGWEKFDQRELRYAKVIATCCHHLKHEVRAQVGTSPSRYWLNTYSSIVPIPTYNS